MFFCLWFLGGCGFVTRQRTDGTSYVCTTNNVPDWVTDIIFEAHGDKLPDDYIYRWVESAVNNIADNGVNEDNMYEQIDSEVDVYISDLTEWLHSRNDRVYYMNEAREELGIEDAFQLLAGTQYCEIRDVFYSVYQSLEEQI